jgi:phage internal scaffolding protein
MKKSSLFDEKSHARADEVPVFRFFDFEKHSGVRDDVDSFEPSLTRQEFAEECDINTIMQRYEATGIVSHVNHAEPVFLDTTLYPGMQGSLDAFREAGRAFNALPAKVRREFDNDPAKFVEFAVDPANVERMREWGLAAPKPAPVEPIEVSVREPRIPPKAPQEPSKPD